MQEELIDPLPSGVLVGIWWSMIWRAFVWWAAVTTACLAGTAVLCISLTRGFDMEREQALHVGVMLFYPLMVCAVLVAPLAVIKKLFGKHFGGYRLLLVKDEPNA